MKLQNQRLFKTLIQLDGRFHSGNGAQRVSLKYRDPPGNPEAARPRRKEPKPEREREESCLTSSPPVPTSLTPSALCVFLRRWSLQAGGVREEVDRWRDWSGPLRGEEEEEEEEEACRNRPAPALPSAAHAFRPAAADRRPAEGQRRSFRHEDVVTTTHAAADRRTTRHDYRLGDAQEPHSCSSVRATQHAARSSLLWAGPSTAMLRLRPVSFLSSLAKEMTFFLSSRTTWKQNGSHHRHPGTTDRSTRCSGLAADAFLEPVSLVTSSIRT
ncbi:hypothetical protein EYF80_043449 [Liparis tanakae]|uniref:Uncharacterized protein n=1 Tax=Liparis tanakae TaxID=230148 RepID=A0A4Z2FZF4_9TELE|nr:hypothetical protein EYF80_043449 [Liparis tanakae]